MPGGPGSLILGYGRPRASAAEDAVRRLAAVIDSVTAGTGGAGREVTGEPVTTRGGAGDGRAGDDPRREA